jgi:hypothetical protein
VYIVALIGYFVEQRFGFSIAPGFSLPAIVLTIPSPSVLAIPRHAEIRA